MKAAQDTAQPTVDSRQRILDAATRLMSERGYAGTSISMITKLSGLPASSTYWHFGSKERLLSEVLEHAATSFLHSLPRLEDVEGTPRERVHKIVRVAFARNQGDDPDFLLGTDSLGRDILAMIVHGARATLLIGLFASAVATLIGVTVGATAGYFGGWVDAVVSRFTDLAMAFPLLLFVVMIGSLFSYGLTRWTFHGLLNQGVFQLIVVIGAFTWFYPARIVRAQMQSLRRREFVEAAQMIGARDSRIIRTHLIPHVLPPLLAYGTLLVATNIMIEVGVTFLGAGIKLPTASWGSLLAQTWGSILNPNPYNPATTQPWLTVCPSIAIFLTVFALNQFGEGLREATDPRAVR